MSVLINSLEARKIVAGSQERKNDLIDLLNIQIRDQAERGLRWAHLPSGISTEEETWLKEELTLQGYKISDSHPIINW